MLELSDKHFKVFTIKLLQDAIENILEMIGKIESPSKEIEDIKDKGLKWKFYSWKWQLKQNAHWIDWISGKRWQERVSGLEDG